MFVFAEQSQTTPTDPWHRLCCVAPNYSAKLLTDVSLLRA